MHGRQGGRMTARHALFALALPALAILPGATAARAQVAPITLGDGFALSPLFDARLRWESVEADPRSAHAETLRIRAGAELAHAPSHLSLLAEGSGTIPFGSAHSAFSYAAPSAQYRPERATIADGASLGLNRLQLRYATKAATLTLGRQRVIIDDQRFVGNGPWRQTEQTFDAARAQLARGVLMLDATHAIRQNTVNGTDGAPRHALPGRFTFISGGLVTPNAALKGFAYLLDYEPRPFLDQPGVRSTFDSSQTFGLRSTNRLPLGHGVALAITGSIARQSAFARNPNPYAATYSSLEGALTLGRQTATITREVLGADRRAGWAVQTPMSSLHKFNGWADMFLTTPAGGLRDTALGLGGPLPAVKGVPRVTYAVAHHWFGADAGALRYGKEIDASLGLSTGRIAWLAKLADYRAQGFGVNTRKLWLQAEFVF
jgi:hypothetical protein